MNRNVLALIVVSIVVLIGAIFALIGSQNSITAFGTIPVFGLCVAIAFIIQWIAFVPAAALKTEKFYDLTGSFTFIVVLLLAIILTSANDITSLLLVLLVLIWTLRLGFFLFRRIMASGGDNRFNEIKHRASRFLITWSIQGLWVSITFGAALAAITSENKSDFGVIGIIGLIIWLAGFLLESIADYQKSAFRSNQENKSKFIKTGLWSRSRHPNYFGEILVWLGIAIIALPNLTGLRLLTLVSPLFVLFLLTKVSGVPLLEKSADKKWGGQEDYEQYKKKTPVLVPKLF